MALLLGDIVINGSSGEGVAFKNPVLLASTKSNSINVDFRSGSKIDGIVLAVADRILIKNQTNQWENGIYIVNASGSPTRSDDFLDNAQVRGFMIYIESGNVNSDTMWICTSDKPNDVVGDDNIIFKLLADTKHPNSTNNPHDVTLEQTRERNNQVLGNIEFLSGTITGIPNPIDSTDVCNKNYVDKSKLHMIDPRTAVSITYDEYGRVLIVSYGNGEKKQIQYHTRKNIVNAIIYTTKHSVITKFFHYDSDERVTGTRISRLES